MRLVTVPVVLWVLWVVLLWGCAGPTHAKTHEFSLEGVSSYLMVNNFGYRAGGSILLDLSGLRVHHSALFSPLSFSLLSLVLLLSVAVAVLLWLSCCCCCVMFFTTVVALLWYRTVVVVAVAVVVICV